MKHILILRRIVAFLDNIEAGLSDKQYMRLSGAAKILKEVEGNLASSYKAKYADNDVRHSVACEKAYQDYLNKLGELDLQRSDNEETIGANHLREQAKLHEQQLKVSDKMQELNLSI